MRNVTCNGDDPLLTMTNRKRQLSSSSSSSSKKSCSPARYIRYVYKVTPVAFKNNFDNTASVNDAKTSKFHVFFKKNSVNVKFVLYHQYPYILNNSFISTYIIKPRWCCLC